jgi:hypothetical protein
MTRSPRANKFFRPLQRAADAEITETYYLSQDCITYRKELIAAKEKCLLGVAPLPFALNKKVKYTFLLSIILFFLLFLFFRWFFFLARIVKL